MTTTPAVRTYTTTETAAELRKALAKAFPGVKFSVRTARGGTQGWIYVDYVDGPVWDDVEAIAGQFEAEDFNAYTDGYAIAGRPLHAGADGDLHEARYLCSGVTIGRDYTEAAKNWAARTAIEGTRWHALGQAHATTAEGAAYHGSQRLLAATDLTHGTPQIPPR